MIVCICRAKNERDVQRAIDAGAETLTDLHGCGIGNDCGGCHNVLRRMLAANESVIPAHFGQWQPVASCVEEVA